MSLHSYDHENEEDKPGGGNYYSFKQPVIQDDSKCDLFKSSDDNNNNNNKNVSELNDNKNTGHSRPLLIEHEMKYINNNNNEVNLSEETALNNSFTISKNIAAARRNNLVHFEDDTRTNDDVNTATDVNSWIDLHFSFFFF